MLAFVLEGASFVRAWRQARTEARAVRRDVVRHVVVTSDPRLRAVVLVDRDRRLLVGEVARPATRDAVLRHLLTLPQVDRVTYLRIEFVGPRSPYLTASVDLRGDELEVEVARHLDELERAVARLEAISGAVFTVSTPEEPSLRAPAPSRPGDGPLA
ncbi:hypothetical protein GCM10009718_03510 [Isoptericola halotolerans]|uniref:L-asparaginase II n=1 Tax=Isoptericola halotolerans TaxID=300560 RepID=A0ABX2A1Q2_9MICO|nr:hypothetical protein [Isoptericola halotolerans]NOV96724.1 L-asparaginase II [Isoptericola halotolerans]